VRKKLAVSQRFELHVAAWDCAGYAAAFPSTTTASGCGLTLQLMRIWLVIGKTSVFYSLKTLDFLTASNYTGACQLVAVG